MTRYTKLFAEISIYRQIYNIMDIKSQNLNILRPVLLLSLLSPFKIGVKSTMKVYLEQRWQAMLQQHLSDKQFYYLLRWAYIRDLAVVLPVPWRNKRAYLHLYSKR